MLQKILEKWKKYTIIRGRKYQGLFRCRSFVVICRFGAAVLSRIITKEKKRWIF